MLRYAPLLIVAGLSAAPVVPAQVQPEPPVRRPGPTAAFLAVKADDGLFRLTATRGGRAVGLVVDTGATQTILTGSDARRLGVSMDGGEEIELLTANGVATMRRVEVGGLTVAGRRLPPLQVAVASTGLAQSLLGQDALARMGRITIKRDRLEVLGERR